ncbi:radial spoke head 10 homolog B-like [Anneissia japonica]|uniref:radial spoke head 10 homolog B-like n=1 Tax=Anneissia japonica TaxID=1529436 RepID=UPI0014256125|nr:radial spoke head 10 homolog B-like [Anneissia japonica]
MASKSKSKEKKNAKKDKPVVIEEPPAPPEEKLEEIKDEKIEDKPEDDTTTVEQEPPKEPTPSPEVEEPSLCELIVECFEGEVMRGLFEGDGSAYFYGGHVYRGQFFQGLMHGQGVYTWADGVKYEGDFHENSVTGKGMYTWPDGSSYEGDVLNGKRHGHGTFRSISSPSSYTGNWVHGKREGAGIIRYDTDGMSFYEGDWVDNKRHGFGVRRYHSGNVYEGEWVNNKRHGTGLMRWVDVDQSYNGQWYQGIQHGKGDHSWFLKRLPGSQYPLRNQYEGEFVYGKRHGYGHFYYANGAKYDGEWENNMKNGRGVFTLKNGRVFEGIFHDDRMVEYPDFSMDGTNTPDITTIRTRTPDPLGPANIGDGTSRSFESRNTLGPSLTLDIDHLLNQFDDSDREEELQQVMFVTLRHITHLRKVYSYYSSLGHDTATDNTFIMTRLQFWRFLKDCQFHCSGITLMEMDRLLANDKTATDIHSPLDKLLLREFLNHVITLSYHMYEEEHSGKGTVVSWCFSKVITENIVLYSCDVQGRFLCEPRYAVNALGYLERTLELYYAICNPRKASPCDLSLTMREFLFMLNDYKLINDRLSPQMIIQILACDDPAAYDSVDYNLELEMTFLEFFEALIGCAVVFVTEEIVKDPTTPRPSTTISNAAQSSYATSTPASASRASQLEDDEQGITGVNSPPHSSMSPPMSPAQRVASSTEELAQKGSSEKLGSFVLSPRTEAGQESGLDIKHSKLGTARSGTDEAQPLLQSMLSMGDATEHAEDDIIEEEMDDETREFNFWTHQINIFFLRKLFPAYEHMEKIKEKKEIIKAEERALAEQSLLKEQTKEDTSKHLVVRSGSSVELKCEGSVVISQAPIDSKH